MPLGQRQGGRGTMAGMGLVAALSGLLVKALGRIATAAFGSASTLLFGRQPRDRELILSAITLAALAWVATVIGIARPDVGLFLIALVPLANLVPADVARLLMLAVAVLIPAVVGRRSRPWARLPAGCGGDSRRSCAGTS
jgi:hypothetical protein